MAEKPVKRTVNERAQRRGADPPVRANFKTDGNGSYYQVEMADWWTQKEPTQRKDNKIHTKKPRPEKLFSIPLPTVEGVHAFSIGVVAVILRFFCGHEVFWAPLYKSSLTPFSMSFVIQGGRRW